MNKYFLLLLAAALSLSLVIGADKPVAAVVSTAQAVDTSRTVAIRHLQRKSKTTELTNPTVRDPFMSPTQNATVANDSPAYSPPVVIQTAPAFAAFKVLGKQEDDEGWAVFIGEPGNQGKVWVVRAGESFDEHYRVSKLAPPVLVIKNNRSGKSKTFDIGKDEE